MKLIPLTQGYFAKVEDEDFEWLNKLNWNIVTSPITDLIYACTGTRHLKMHTKILNTPIGFEVDHINGDGLDNRRSNLRIVTHAQNSYNRKLNKNNSTGFRGVYRNYDKFVASIKINGKKYALGRFKFPIDASIAYQNARKKYFGAYSREFSPIDKGSSHPL